LEAVAAGKVREIAFSPKLAIASFIIRYRDEGATPGEYETAASEHVGDSRKRLVVTLANASRHIGINLVSVSALAICHSSLRSWQVEHHQHRFQG